jgi:hypothetical protein
LLYVNDIKTADLDKDGWLDLIAGSLLIPDTQQRDYGVYIYWGGSEGFDPTNAQRLPGHSVIGQTVADFDGDGYLDLYFPNYHYGSTRESIASYLFWGSADGFLAHRRTDLMVDSGHGAVAADFNGDGLKDLAVYCHSRNGDHLTNSLVYYNDGGRFSHPHFVRLPSVGASFPLRAEVGNIYDRSYKETYTHGRTLTHA